MLLEFSERLLEPLERVAHAALHRVLRDLQDLRDLAEAEVRDLAHEIDLALILGQLFDRVRDPIAELGPRRDALDVGAGARVGRLLTERRTLAFVAPTRLVQRAMPPMGGLAELVDAEVAHDGVDPGRETSVGFEVVSALRDAHEGLLHDVFGSSAFADVTQREIVEGVLVPSDERGERCPVAALVSGDEHFVGEITVLPQAPPSLSMPKLPLQTEQLHKRSLPRDTLGALLASKMRRCVIAAMTLSISLALAGPARADDDDDDEAPSRIDAAAAYDIDTMSFEGLERTKQETLLELLPRPLPARLSGVEIVEVTRRIRNLELFDRLEVDVRGRDLHVKVRRKVTIQPIFDFSTGKTVADTSVTLGAVENDIDGHGTKLGGEVGYDERTVHFAAWLMMHPYRPRRFANEVQAYFGGSAFRFEGADAGTEWLRQRLGGELVFLLPFAFGSRWRFEIQGAVYRETFVHVEGGREPRSGVYVGPTSEIVFDAYSFHDLTPSGLRMHLEIKPGILLGPAEPRHEARLKALGAMKLLPYTALVAEGNALAVNAGNVNHSVLVGSQEGVRGLPDALFRTRSAAYLNVELRQAIPLGKRWYVQGVLFSDQAGFEPMTARGHATDARFAWSTGFGARLLPTALVDTLLRVDVARLHYPTELASWFVQVGISQYIGGGD